MLVAPGLMVLIPHDGTRQSADRLRRWYAEKVKPVAAAWSIEYGRHGTGYHLNIIADLIGDIAPPGARVLKAPIRTTIRATAAYITKREQAPPHTDDRRRNTGTLGNVIDHCATAKHSPPIVKAAALQQVLRRTEPAPPSLGTDRASDARPMTDAEYRAIAVARLQQLRNKIERLKPTPSDKRNGVLNCTHNDNKKAPHTIKPP